MSTEPRSFLAMTEHEKGLIACALACSIMTCEKNQAKSKSPGEYDAYDQTISELDNLFHAVLHEAVEVA